MAKKKKHKHQHRIRNAAPRAPRAGKPEEETTTHRLGYTAAGAAGSALMGALLARQGWAPKTVSGTLAAVGAGLAWKGEGATIRSVGAGAMSAAGAQLALLVLADHEEKKQQSQPTQIATAPNVTSIKKPANADDVPIGALQDAFNRARERLAVSAGELEAA